MNMNKTYAVIAIIVVLIVAGGLWWTLMTPSAEAPVITEVDSTTTMPTATTPASGSHGTSGTPAKPALAPTPVPHSSAPVITKFAPASGTSGTQVTIIGTGFDKTTNYLRFGTSSGDHRTDGSADNEIAVIPSTDGTTITFTVPSSGPSGILCDASDHCIAIAAKALVAGNYPISIRTANGVSNIAYFVLQGSAGSSY